MRAGSMVVVLALFGCGTDEDGETTLTHAGPSDSTNPTQSTSTGGGSGTLDACVATIASDWDEDGEVDRVRFEQWAPFPERPLARVDHASHKASPVLRRDRWVWDDRGNNVEYARDDFDDGVEDSWKISTFDEQDLPVVVWTRDDEGDREVHYTNVDGRPELADLDLEADGVIDTTTGFTYDATGRLVASATSDAMDGTPLSHTTISYLGPAPVLDRLLHHDLDGDGLTDRTWTERYDPTGQLIEQAVDGADGGPISHQLWIRDVDGLWLHTTQQTFLLGTLVTTSTTDRARDEHGLLTEVVEVVETFGDKIPDSVTREEWTWVCPP